MKAVELNIHYLFSLICIILLIAYLWLGFVPSMHEYPEVRGSASVVTALLAVAAVLLVVLSVKGSRT